MPKEKYDYQLFFTVEQDASNEYLPNFKSTVLNEDDLTEEQLKKAFSIFLNHPDCYTMHISKQGFTSKTVRKNDK